MGKSTKTKRAIGTKQNKNITHIAVVVGAILLVPLFGDIFVEGWNWGIFDFIVAAILLFGTGLAIDFAVKKVTNTLYRVIAVIAIVMILLLIWVELAVAAVSQLVAWLL